MNDSSKKSTLWWDIASRVLTENMEIDWQSQVPTQEAQPEPEQPQSNNPDVQYIIELCQGIKEKLDLLQEAASREEIQEYGESQIKALITDLIEIETKITDNTTTINSISDLMNNVARTQGAGNNLQMINGLISL